MSRIKESFKKKQQVSYIGWTSTKKGCILKVCDWVTVGVSKLGQVAVLIKPLHGQTVRLSATTWHFHHGQNSESTDTSIRRITELESPQLQGRHLRRLKTDCFGLIAALSVRSKALIWLWLVLIQFWIRKCVGNDLESSWKLKVSAGLLVEPLKFLCQTWNLCRNFRVAFQYG